MRRARWLTIVSLLTVGIMLIGAVLLAAHRRHIVLGSEEHEHGEWMEGHAEHEHSTVGVPTTRPRTPQDRSEPDRPEAAKDVPAEDEGHAHDGHPHEH